MEFGARSAVTALITAMLQLPAVLLDLGRSLFMLLYEVVFSHHVCWSVG